MRPLILSLLALLALGLLGATLSPARAVAPPQGGATTTYLPMMLKPPLLAPSVSNAHYTVFAINYFACPNEVTLFHMKMDYLDANADVTQDNSKIRVSLIDYKDVSAIYDGSDILISGDGSQGVAQAAVCLGFGGDDNQMVRIGLELYDATGRISNRTDMTVLRPRGANLQSGDSSSLPTLGTIQEP